MEVDQAVQNAGGHSYARVEAPGEFSFCLCKTKELVCLSGRRWKPEQQQTQGQQVPQRKGHHEQQL